MNKVGLLEVTTKCRYSIYRRHIIRAGAATEEDLGRIHTGSGSVPDSSEPNASGRLCVGFAFTLLTTDPT